MKLALLLTLLFLPLLVAAQTGSPHYLQEIDKYQRELNAEYADPEKSPLEPADLEAFAGLPFFPIDEKYRVIARFVRTRGSKPFKMPTSTDRLPIYEKYGEAHFELEGKAIVLPVYQNHELRKKKGYKDYLFVPFTDLTNGTDSYGGGRYLDLRIPAAGDSLVIDFNKAYNPYCAYSSRYSCPIPPRENRIPLAIKAGVMYSGEHHD